MFSKKTRNLSLAMLALVMALTTAFGLLGFGNNVSALTETTNADGTVTTVFDFESAEQGTWTWGTNQTNNSSTINGFNNGKHSAYSGSGYLAVKNGASKESYYATSSVKLGAVSSLSFYEVSSEKNKTNLKFTISQSGNFDDEIVLVDQDTSNNLCADGSLSNNNWELSSTFTAPANDGGYLRIYFISGSSSGKFWGIDQLSVIAEPSTVKFNVTYNYNDGETENLVEEYTQGDPAITLEEPVRTGYTFLGWSDGTTIYQADAEFTPTADVTLTAQWSYNYVNVIVDGVKTEVEKNTTYALDIPEREGKNFLGWSYADDNTATIVPTADQLALGSIDLAVLDSDITLYTCWSVQDGLLIYNSIDGETSTVELATNPTVAAYDTLFTAVDANVYTFEKWVDATGTEYALGTAVTGATTVQLYPVFKVQSYVYEEMEAWAGETFDMALLPADYEGFAVNWTANGAQYTGKLTPKNYFNVAETTLTQNVKFFNYLVADDVDLGTVISLGVDGVNGLLPATAKLTGTYTLADGTHLEKAQDFALTWDTSVITGPGSYKLKANIAHILGFEETANVTINVEVKNAKVAEFTFDFPNNAELTAEEWATIPGFSGTAIYGNYAGNNLTCADGTVYATYLNIYKTATAQLVYTLPIKAYVTAVEVEYAGGTKDKINLVVTANYADGTTKAVNLATNGNWVVCNGTAAFDSQTQTNTITFTSSNTAKNMAIKSVKISYVSLASDSKMTLDVNGGDSLAQTEYVVKGGDSFTLPNATRAATTETRYTFLGWQAGEKLYKVGESLYPDSDMTFVAQWGEVSLNTPITGLTLENSKVETLVGGAVNYPATATATYGDGLTTQLKLTLAEGQNLVDTANIGIYTLTYNVDNENGFFVLGEYATVTFEVTVYEWKVISVETVNLTVKQGATLVTPATVNAVVQKWNGTTAYGEMETKAFVATWEAFDSTQEIKPGYSIAGALTTEAGYNLGEFTAVTANVEINNFEYSAVKSIWFKEKESYNQLEAYGYTKGGSTKFDESKDDEYWGLKLDAGGYIQFTLNKETHVVIGLSGLATKKNVAFQFGYLNEEGMLVELSSIASFEQEQYQVIDQVLQAGTYRLINNAADSKNNVNVSYIQILDGGQQFFIPSKGSNVAPENTDKANFIGWTDGTTLYTVGATMPVASTNKNAKAYEPYYGNAQSFGTVLGYTLLGYLQESTMTLVPAIDTTVATGYTAINAKAAWVDGAALRIAGASSDSAEDKSALKFILNLEFSSNVAALVNNMQQNNLTFALENAGSAEYTLFKSVTGSNTMTVSLYVEKVASLGLANTAIAPKVSLNGSEYITANAYTAKFIAQKALADAKVALEGEYKFLLGDNNYSRFNDAERAELQKYIDLAPVDQGGDDKPDESSSSSGENSDSASTDQPSTSIDTPNSSEDNPNTSTDEPNSSTDSPNSSEDNPNTSTDEPNSSEDNQYTSYY